MDTRPIDELLPQLKAALAYERGAVLTAAPGAGKTTRVPLALMDEPWLKGGKIVMLEPRRLAARSAARYMAAQLGEPVGSTVGYRVRMDTKAGPQTRIEVVTEGVLTRMLQDDPGLDGIGLVIFDEFHERSLHADLGLALCLQTKALLREDLRLLVMSATMDAAPVAQLIGGVPVIAGQGRQFPVATMYRPPAGSGKPLEETVASVVEEALRDYPDGDLLVFLPGMAEIRRTERLLERKRGSALWRNVHIRPLHGSLPAAAQDAALAPADEGTRKVVLATSVAETSLTVEGVTIVIDSGLSRVSRFSPRSGMSRLETTAVSLASADQRRGRAGRTAPGVCYRLWSKEQERQLPAFHAPEIREADLAPLALELAVWGVRDPDELKWLDSPPVPAMNQAHELLRALGALTPDGALTPHGRDMAALGVHPRLAHMLLRAWSLGLGRTACEVAVLLEERDLARLAARGKAGSQTPDASNGRHGQAADFRSGLEALHGKGTLIIEESARRRMLDEAGRLQRACTDVWRRKRQRQQTDNRLDARAGHAAESAVNEADVCGLLLAFAYPDRIGRRREGGKFLLSGGRGAAFPSDDEPLAREPWIVAADVEDAGSESRIRLAAPISLDVILRHFRDEIREEQIVEWDRDANAVRAGVRRKLGALLLAQQPLPSPSPEQVSAALLAGVREIGIEALPWTRAGRQFQQRVQFARHIDPSWPDMSDETLLATGETWLLPYLHGMRSLEELKQRLRLQEALESLLTWDLRRKLDSYAPTHWTVPSGSRIPIDYSDPAAPVLAVRLQELFGLSETPRIADGRVPLTLHLLSPAQRPVQITRDLASFWATTYFDVRKDLKGRYPKHDWPDNPLEAEPTRRAKPRR